MDLSVRVRGEHCGRRGLLTVILQAELAESRKRRCVVNTGTDGGRRGTATPEIRGNIWRSS